MIIIDNDTSFDGKISEDVIITKGCTFVLHGMSMGRIHITENSNMILHGTANGEILIDKGSSLNLSGMVNNKINNHGMVEIFGISKHVIDEGQSFIINSGAIIAGKQF